MSSITEKEVAESRDDSAYPDVLTTHNYDGIQEYDNPMPGWWTWLFILTIVWSGIYVFGRVLGYVDSYQEDLHAELDEAAARAAEQEAAQPTVDDQMLASAIGDESQIAAGAQVYATNCASCHGDQGQGLIGPNLTDNAWLHGNEPMAIFTVVDEGVPDKGMPAWGSILSQEDQVALVAYIASLKGTNPPDAKPPEGKEYATN